jgi:cardiolipin synthase
MSLSLIALLELLGLFSAVHAVLRGRTPQGTIAWVVCLLTMPALSVPVYWVFGRSKFNGYVDAWRDQSTELARERDVIYQGIKPYLVTKPADYPEYGVVGRVSQSLLLRGNRVELLVDGAATYASLYQGIEQAKSYVLFQFYILRADISGNRFKDLLVKKAQQGLAIYVIYDELGSASLMQAWLSELRDTGIRVVPFNTRQGFQNRFQLNFRNHRKNVVVDGVACWMGGLNIGDDYLGKNRKLTPWRDTHLRIEGPAVLLAQAIFWSDWHWADKTFLRGLSWTPRPAVAVAAQAGVDTPCSREVLVFGSGPADQLETASLFFTNAINGSRGRIWIATPYFIPDEATMAALRLAVLKGVDVRIITPEVNDNWLIANAAKVYLGELSQLGARIFSFRRGFMHQKVMLVDDSLSVVGTVNFDNRSFRLNFEISAVVFDCSFGAELEAMLLRDLDNSLERINCDLGAQSWWQQLKARGADLLAPVL